jgi:hypothetical protein
VKEWSTPTKVAFAVKMIFATLWVLVGLYLVLWIAQFSPGFAIVILLVLLAPKIAMWIFTYRVLQAKSPKEASPAIVPLSSRLLNEPEIYEELNRVDAVRAPAWVKESVADWLATVPGDEKNSKRAALLDRLYSYAATSTDDYAARSAVNQLRLAINPWVKD